MARKRSVSGRARAKTAENKLFIQAQKINRRLRALERGGEYGAYKSKDLMQYVSRTPYLSIKKAKGSKRHRLVISKVPKTMGQIRETMRKLGNIIKSKVFHPTGIKRVRKETRQKLLSTLSEQAGRKLTDRDVDMFYDIIDYSEEANQSSILDEIDPSLFMYLVNVAKERGYGVSQWINLLSNYASINNEYRRKEAEELYYKFVV